MKTQIRNIFAMLMVATFAMGLSACNTVKGIGKDTEKAGEKIQKEAGRHDDNTRHSASGSRS